MTPQARKGKAVLQVYIALVLLASARTILLYVSIRGTDRVPAQLARLFLTSVLCFWLYWGSKAAKLISVVLLTIGGALALPAVLENSPLAILWGGGMAVLYLSFARLLLWSEIVNAFLSHQRGD